MTHKAANHLTKATQGSGSHSSPGRGVRGPHKSQEELCMEYIMQAKQLCTNQKSTEGKGKKKKSTSLCLFCSTEKEGGFFHPPHPLRNNPAAKLTDLIITCLILLKKIIIKATSLFFCGFLEPSVVWKVSLCW